VVETPRADAKCGARSAAHQRQPVPLYTARSGRGGRPGMRGQSPPRSSTEGDTPREPMMLESIRGSPLDPDPPPSTRLVGRASHRRATQPPGNTLPQPMADGAPPWAPPTPMPEARPHRRPGGSPMHVVTQRWPARGANARRGARAHVHRAAASSLACEYRTAFRPLEAAQRLPEALPRWWVPREAAGRIFHGGGVSLQLAPGGVQSSTHSDPRSETPRSQLVAPHGLAPKPWGATNSAPHRKQRASDRV